MSEQPSPKILTNTSEKAEFGGLHLLIGFVIGAALQFGWWALLDRLSLRTAVPSNAGFFAQLMAAIGQSHTAGLLFGAVGGATNNPAGVPIRPVIWKSIRWAIGFGLALYGLDVMRFILQAALGESLGDIVVSAVWLGFAGAFIGLVLELRRTVAPNIGSAVLSFGQLAKRTLELNRAAVLRVLAVALLGGLIGVTIEMFFQRLNAWPLMLVSTLGVAIVALRLWRPSTKTLRQWAIGISALLVIAGLFGLLNLSVPLGVLGGIVVLVVMILVQSRNDPRG